MKHTQLKLWSLAGAAIVLTPVTAVGVLAGKGIRVIGNLMAKSGDTLAKASVEPFNAVGRKMWKIGRETNSFPIEDIVKVPTEPPQIKV